jgi:hypothetical protein
MELDSEMALTVQFATTLTIYYSYLTALGLIELPYCPTTTNLISS